MKIPVAMLLTAAAVAAAQNPPALPGSGNVSLPLDEYNRLKELAAKPPKPPDTAPIAYALQSAAYKLSVQERAVTGKLELEGEVLRQGAVKVPLVSGITVLDAHRGSAPLPLTQENGVHSAVLEGPGAFSLSLDAGVPVVTEPGRASFTLPAPAAGAVRLSLIIPGEQTVVSLSPGLITARSSSGGHTEIEATLPPGAATRVSWAVRLAAMPPAPPKELKFLSDVKTLVSVNQGEVTLASLAELTVTQGEAAQFELQVPAGYEITGASGASLLRTEARAGSVLLYVNGANVRSHQFLISMTKTENGGKLDVALPSFTGALRETGEAMVEGAGAIEMEASAQGGLRRDDVKEASAPLRSLATLPVYAAFRYQKKPGENPGLGLSWTRFPDASEIAAIAQKAVVTTLVTSEGRSLTEVKLTVKNQAQPFLKVDLPAGASILSADVAGEKVKPVQGADGNRIPLLRSGFRPAGAYTVSFVFLNSGAPFSKKGSGALDLPRMDIPVGVTQWEVFLPRQFAVSEFAGDAIPAELMPAASDMSAFAELRDDKDDLGPGGAVLANGQLSGYVSDLAGTRIPNAAVAVTNLATGAIRNAETDASGHWTVYGLPAGRVRVVTSAPGFTTQAREVDLHGAAAVNTRLQVGGVNETVEVTAEAATINTVSASVSSKTELGAAEQRSRQNAAPSGAASQNVLDLEKRVAGVLPVSIQIPHAGNSYRFVRPLVVSEVTHLTFSYRATK